MTRSLSRLSDGIFVVSGQAAWSSLLRLFAQPLELGSESPQSILKRLAKLPMVRWLLCVWHIYLLPGNGGRK
jgi:hypothetical protein